MSSIIDTAFYRLERKRFLRDSLAEKYEKCSRWKLITRFRLSSRLSKAVEVADRAKRDFDRLFY